MDYYFCQSATKWQSATDLILKLRHVLCKLVNIASQSPSLSVRELFHVILCFDFSV